MKKRAVSSAFELFNRLLSSLVFAYHTQQVQAKHDKRRNSHLNIIKNRHAHLHVNFLRGKFTTVVVSALHAWRSKWALPVTCLATAVNGSNAELQNTLLSPMYERKTTPTLPHPWYSWRNRDSSSSTTVKQVRVCYSSIMVDEHTNYTHTVQQ